MKKRRILSFILALSMGLSSAFAIGCGGGGGGRGDDTKAIVRVGANDAGWGIGFAEEWEAVYEELHKNDVYVIDGEEKIGVDVVVETDSQYGGDMASTTYSSHDIILAETLDYRLLADKGDLVNISDWVNGVNPYDGKKIYDKILSQDQINFFTDNGGDNNFYAVPNYQASYNMYYDRDLFEEKGLFLKETTLGNEVVVSVTSSKIDFEACKAANTLTAGPDNVRGNEDDGLPRTTEEFVKLFTEMSQRRNVTPITIPSGSGNYNEQFLLNLWTSFSGYENMMTNFDFNGTERLVKEINSDGTPHYDDEVTTITPENGYELQRQDGKYFALDFYSKIFAKQYGFGADVIYRGTLHNKNSQEYFLRAGIDGDYADEKRCAVNVDGTFWYTESYKIMEQMGGEYAPTRGGRRIGVLPNPRKPEVFEQGNEIYGQKQATFSTTLPSIFVNANELKEEGRDEVVKDFFQFMLSDPGLTIYSLSVNATMAYDYELVSKFDTKYAEGGQYEIKLNKYAEDASYFLEDVVRIQNTYDFVSPQVANSMADIGACPINSEHRLSWNTYLGTNTTITKTVFKALAGSATENPKYTAADYFMGLRKTITAAQWEKDFSKGFNI